MGALTRRNDLLDFGNVFKEFISSSATSVSTGSQGRQSTKENNAF